MMAPNLDNILPFSAFEKLTKNEIYQIYCEVYQANQRKDQIIHNYLKTITEKNERRTEENQPIVIQPNVNANPGNINTETEKVRTFNNFFLKETQQNLVLGSSIVAHLSKDKTIPQDVAIHGYQGSSTREKIAVLKNISRKQMKTVVLQDGSNSLLKKKHYSVPNVFDTYKELVKNVLLKFEADYLYLCEVPPMMKSLQNRAQNERIKEFNRLLFDFIESNDSDATIKLLPLAESSREIPNYNSYYYDEIHLNFSWGLPFLKNLKESNGLPAKPKHIYHPRDHQ